MGLMTGLPQVIEEAKKEYDGIGGTSSGISFTLAEELGTSENLLAMGDNAGFMKHLLEVGDVHPPFQSHARRCMPYQMRV